MFFFVFLDNKLDGTYGRVSVAECLEDVLMILRQHPFFNEFIRNAYLDDTVITVANMSVFKPGGKVCPT